MSSEKKPGTINFSPVKSFTSPLKNRENQEYFKLLETIVKTLLANQAKWELAQQRGTSLCSSIQRLKLKSMEHNISETCSYYPKELNDYCRKFEQLLTICEDICNTSLILIKQVSGLVKLNNNSSDTFCKTWSILNFFDALESIQICYKKELKIKKKVAVQIAHCQKKDLIIYSKLWKYPEHTDEDFKLAFLFMQQEVKHIFK